MSQALTKHWMPRLQSGKRQNSYSQSADNSAIKTDTDSAQFVARPIVKTRLTRGMYNSSVTYRSWRDKEAGGRCAPHSSHVKSLREGASTCAIKKKFGVCQLYKGREEHFR